MKKILVLHHDDIAGLGELTSLIAKDFEIVVIKLTQGDVIPDNLNQYSAMICLGGSVNTWMEEKYSWLKIEKSKIREFVKDLQKPFLGICLGSQLLAESLGAKIMKMPVPELGIGEISLNKSSFNDLVFKDFGKNMEVMQWHFYQTQGLENNKDVELLASSDICKYQIFRYKNHAYGVQFHPEAQKQLVDIWISSYQKKLKTIFSKDEWRNIYQKISNELPSVNNDCVTIYNNFKKLI